MKAGTVEHVKFKRLKRALKLTDWECVGILESIWNFTAHSHMDGAIGNSSNLDIALAIEWLGNEDELIDSLVLTGWLDKCEKHRLVVHDWENHCPNYVKGCLAKHNKHFAKHYARQGAKQRTKHGAKHGANSTVLPSLVYSSLVYPNHSYPSTCTVEAVRISELVALHVSSIDPKAKTILPQNIVASIVRWSEDIEKLNRLDGRDWAEIESVANWAFSNEFWSTNILSGSKLREKFSTLVARKSKEAVALDTGSYIVGDEIYFPNAPKSAGGAIRHREATDVEIDTAKKKGLYRES